MKKLLKSIYLIFIKMSKKLSRKGIYPFLNKEFSDFKKDMNILNIGAGGQVGELLKEYSIKNGFKVTTFDISEERNPDILGDICSHDFEGLKFNYIVISEVLEHLHSPHLAIDTIWNILEPDGRLVLTVPFIFPIHERPYDYFRFTKYGLEFLLNKFSFVQIEERNSWTETINVLMVRLIMDKKIVSKLFAPFFILFAYMQLPFIYLVSAIINTDFITTGYLVVAKK
ncbi:MAG: hypothetical protein COA79_05615 [Planctomycetota bacterium]|nr:MAG: hypothetical protein COA79_05615 [Planctomycetota bacterium]